jgi:predicted Ser/Thr protein kinase
MDTTTGKVNMVRRLKSLWLSAKLSEIFRLGLQTFSATRQQVYSNRPVFRLSINYTMLDRILRFALGWLLQWLARTRMKPWILALWPGLRLPDNVFLKLKVDDQSFAFNIEKKVYTAYAYEHLQGDLIPCYYGEASCESVPGIVMSEAKGKTLDSLSLEEQTQALAAIKDGYNKLTEAGIIHGDPQPYNVFYHDGHVMFIDFDCASLNEEREEVILLNQGDYESLKEKLRPN